MALKAATKLHPKGSWERLMEESRGYVDGLVGEVISYPEACLAGLRDVNPRMCEGR